jgi:hypothetical protein
MKGQAIILGSLILILIIFLAFNRPISEEKTEIYVENFGNELSDFINFLVLENKSREEIKLFLKAYFDFMEEFVNSFNYDLKGYTFVALGDKFYFLNFDPRLRSVEIDINGANFSFANVSYQDVFERDFNFSTNNSVKIVINNGFYGTLKFESDRKFFHFTELRFKNGKEFSRRFSG